MQKSFIFCRPVGHVTMSFLGPGFFFGTRSHSWEIRLSHDQYGPLVEREEGRSETSHTIFLVGEQTQRRVVSPSIRLGGTGPKRRIVVCRQVLSGV